MMRVNQLAAMATSTQGQQSEQRGSTSSYSEEDKRRVKAFYLRLQTLYGVARYKTSFPDESAERLSMREWAPSILKYDDEQLEARINFAKNMMHVDGWQWPDVGRVLAAAKFGQPAAGQAALSHKPVDPALLLPDGTSEDSRRAGQAALDNLRAMF